ncbi:uncharacterized protein ColSpa_12204 [Colletotrichum spaethianum]|uniref:Uncharacterized protein n=1 Tax=Colletotrichum spaethianum TaxID=700344 RepID=A0AA37UTI6_9PEZI|nr:uncharacterized protein ColSpa_12204 [Colletotrichum spaethianum]GKT52023.1 hypothetical protein ColSpa_12204 [Colletotrichum spaethianum]
MTAIGKIVAVESLDRDYQVFRYQNWSGQIHIPIHTPEWLADTFPDILDTLHAGALSLDLSRFHLGGPLTTDEWEEQWFSIICEPHFSYVPCGLSGEDEVGYKRLAWIQDDALTPISERACIDLPPRFPITPPFVTFNGFVDTQKFPLADNPSIGLDDITRNSSAIFRVWSKFTVTEAAHTPKTGWYANYVYAMLPKCKPHMKKKYKDYRADTTPFRRHGKKAYITGYFHGFCNKNVVFSDGCPYNPLEFVPLIEVLKIDWAAGEPRQQPGARDLLATPSKPETPSRGKGKFIFDPFVQINADAKRPATPSKLNSTIYDDDSFSVNGLHEAQPNDPKRSGEIEVLGDSEDEASPTKRPKRGSWRGRR